MKLGVVGNGVVGHATARAFMESCEVRVYDVVKERSTHNLLEVLDCDLVMICLPTPQKEGSFECDTSAIDGFFAKIAELSPQARKANFVLRSTVPIGTTRRLANHYDLPNLCHSPEFLTARCSITDAQIPARNIIGVWKNEHKNYQHPLFELYKKRFPAVMIIIMGSDESEAVKLMLNSFFAVKIAFFNECHMLASKLQLNWEAIMDGVLSDGRIAHSHTKVPGHDGFGYGGSCLPKDIANLVHCLQKEDLPSIITHAAIARNIIDRRRECNPA